MKNLFEEQNPLCSRFNIPRDFGNNRRVNNIGRRSPVILLPPLCIITIIVFYILKRHVEAGKFVPGFVYPITIWAQHKHFSHMRFILILLLTRQAVPDHSMDEGGSVVFGRPEQSCTNPVLSLQHLIPLYRTKHTTQLRLHLIFQVQIFQHVHLVDYPVGDCREDLTVLYGASRVGTSVDSIHRAHDKFSLIYSSDKVITHSPQSHDVLPALLELFSMRPPRHPQQSSIETSLKSRADQMRPELPSERKGAEAGVG